MNAQVSFLEGTYHLVHIPLPLYSALIHPILRILLPRPQPQGGEGQPGKGQGREDQPLTADGEHGFLNISVTPIECSIVCHSSWIANVFDPVIKTLPRESAQSVQVSSHRYHVLSVISAGMDAAGRVMDLTSPLALAGIPIFFISTYYSDFILVPVKDKKNVIQALLSKGFELSENQSAFVSSTSYAHSRGSSKATTPPSTPPPSSAGDLEARAFDLLKKHNVVPHLEDNLELVQCSGRELSSQSEVLDHRRGSTRTDHPRTWIDEVDTKLYTCMVSALVSCPRFISITLTEEDPPSLLLDRALLHTFGDSIVGDTESKLIPIFLDLVKLPLEISGIVCGVAGRLVQGMQTAGSSDLSYLSTARAGAVMLPQDQANVALDILLPLLGADS